jgi:hypothetical protein
MRCHLTSVRRAAIKKEKTETHQQGRGESGTVCIVGGNVKCAAAMEDSLGWQFLHFTSGYISRRSEIRISGKSCIPMSRAA